MLLEEIAENEQPGVIFEDNTGAIFLARNAQVGARTKHIDVRHHYTRELIEQGKLIVEFVRSAKNLADMMTKCVVEKLFGWFCKKLRSGRLGPRGEDVGRSSGDPMTRVPGPGGGRSLVTDGGEPGKKRSPVSDADEPGSLTGGS